jgi:argininosuccinate lyase
VVPRDLQLLKEGLFHSKLTSLLDIAIFSIKDIKVKDNILIKKYDYLFTVDTLNEMVVAGMPLEMPTKRLQNN